MAFSSFQFTQPLLINSQFEMRRKQKAEDDVQVHLGRKIVRLKDDNKKAIIELKVQLNKAEDQERDDPCFIAEVTMQSMFSWTEETDEKQAEALLNVNAPALLLSYARPIIAQLTSASPLQTYNIPFINMNELFVDAMPQGIQ